MKYYAGIGSIETPPDIEKFMAKFAVRMEANDFVLRSGGADGADLAFERGVTHAKEIFLPWKGFNGSTSNLYVKNFSKEIQEREAELARKYHPIYDKLSYGAQCMMRRNMHQVFGQDLDTPSSFVVCWTQNGKDIGGTGTAIRAAWDNDIPVYNLKNADDIKKLIVEIIDA
jgi:hypothetical protein